MKIIIPFLAAIVYSTAAASQSFDDVVAQAQSQVGEIEKYQKALQNPDQKFQYALVQQMLKLQDPALQRIAKEHALFSTNPVMREAAIKAILDSGTTLRIQIATTTETTEKIGDWLQNGGGTFTSPRGEILWKAPSPVDNECWGSERHCQFRQVGNTLQFNPAYPGNYVNYINAVLTLGNDGILRGTLSYKNEEFAQVQIDLKE